eukprot:15324396-Ditylum_brightwellii.AAC.1
MRKYKSDLNTWNQRNPANKTWTAFKAEMHNAQKALHSTGELTVQDAINQEKMLIWLLKLEGPK